MGTLLLVSPPSIYIYRPSYEDSTDSLFNLYALEYPIHQAR